MTDTYPEKDTIMLFMFLFLACALMLILTVVHREFNFLVNTALAIVGAAYATIMITYVLPLIPKFI